MLGVGVLVGVIESSQLAIRNLNLIVARLAWREIPGTRSLVVWQAYRARYVERGVEVLRRRVSHATTATVGKLKKSSFVGFLLPFFSMSDGDGGLDGLRSHPVIYCKYVCLWHNLTTYRIGRWRGCGAILATVPSTDLARTHVAAHFAKEPSCKSVARVCNGVMNNMLTDGPSAPLLLLASKQKLAKLKMRRKVRVTTAETKATEAAEPLSMPKGIYRRQLLWTAWPFCART